jgi:hypothetical protein
MLESDEDENACKDRCGCGHVRRNIIEDATVNRDNHDHYRQH